MHVRVLYVRRLMYSIYSFFLLSSSSLSSLLHPPSFFSSSSLPPPLPASSFSPTFLLPSSYLLPTFPPSPPSHPLSLPSPQVSSKSFAVHPPSLEQRKLFFFPVLLTRPTQPPPPKPRPCSGKITDEPPFWASGFHGNLLEVKKMHVVY